VCDQEGHRAVQLTRFGGPFPGSPRWSPDGRRIAFDLRAQGNADVYVIDADGATPRRLTTDPATESVPSWSRDGKSLYFTSNRTGSFQIWMMPAGGGPAVQVTHGGGYESVESADGTYVYYSKDRRVPGIWRVPAGGGEETLVLDHDRAGILRYWSVKPNGIYFATAESPAHPVIRLFDLLTRRTSVIATLDKPLLVGTPGLSLSPDARWLLYAQVDQSGSDLMLVENFR
jgi:Tol biopolymer transport system component